MNVHGEKYWVFAVNPFGSIFVDRFSTYDQCLDYKKHIQEVMNIDDHNIFIVPDWARMEQYLIFNGVGEYIKLKDENPDDLMYRVSIPPDGKNGYVGLTNDVREAFTTPVLSEAQIILEEINLLGQHGIKSNWYIGKWNPETSQIESSADYQPDVEIHLEAKEFLENI